MTICRTRQKRLAGIKSLDIYAVALYVDESGVTSLLGDRALKSADEDSFAHDDAMFAGVFGHDYICICLFDEGNYAYSVQI